MARTSTTRFSGRGLRISAAGLLLLLACILALLTPTEAFVRLPGLLNPRRAREDFVPSLRDNAIVHPVARWGLGRGLWDDFVRDFDELIDDHFSRFGLPMGLVKTGDNQYTMQVDVPGLRAEDLNIHVEGRQLHVTGTNKCDDQDPTCVRRTIEKTVTIPEGAGEIDLSNVRAVLDHGVLKVTVSLTGAPTPKRVPIVDASKETTVDRLSVSEEKMGEGEQGHSSSSPISGVVEENVGGVAVEKGEKVSMGSGDDGVTVEVKEL